MIEFAPRELFAAQIKRGKLCVFTVIGQATAFFAWLGRRKRRVTWEMAEMKKSSRRANFLQHNLNVAICVFSLFLARQRPFLRGWDAIKDVYHGKWLR